METKFQILPVMINGLSQHGQVMELRRLGQPQQMLLPKHTVDEIQCCLLTDLDIATLYELRLA